ncbi:hypothetical protein [Paenirhodobacter sp.]|uniref:hypothetical protein n=1 Tax=Paenirhodobacter sp. TaxID=1965326 RepID=UPI003B3F6BC0
MLDVVDGPGEAGSSPVVTRKDSQDASAMPSLGAYWTSKVLEEDRDGRQAPPDTVRVPAVPASRVAEAEQKLLESLSRATAQGIFSVDMTRKGARTPGNITLTARPAGEPSDEEELAVRSQTVIDRDLDLSGDEPRILLSGQRCMPDALFDLQSWRTDAPVPDQIAAARAALVGEFDRPDPDAAVALARLYLALGFGAEARDVLRGFDLPPRTAAAYAYIAGLLEETGPTGESPITAMTGCNGKVALWALLGATPLPAMDQIDLQAVQAAFSGLPPDIRNMLGPDLVDRLLAVGARDAAHAVVNSLGRSPDPRGAALAIAQARIDLDRGQPEAVEKGVMPIARSNDAAAARALIMAIDARLERNRPVDRESVENAAALAQELGASQEGLLLRRATALGEGSVGAFNPAFAALDNWPRDASPDLQLKARRELYAQLALVPDDEIFLKQFLRREADAIQVGLPPKLQLALSARLAAAGFARQAAAILADTTKATADGRFALARAALAEPDPAAAVSHLEGLDGEQAERLRAKALARLGEHAVAAQILAASGDAQGAGREAWRAGDWSLVDQYGSEVQKQAARLLARAGDGDAAVPPGLLARSNQLLERSQEERRLFDALLSQ